MTTRRVQTVTRSVNGGAGRTSRWAASLNSFHMAKRGQHGPPKNERAPQRQRAAAPIGNYQRYYGYRGGGARAEDPRLSLLRREWFEGLKVIDIGCNSGALTAAIARKFSPRYVLGVDADKDLIEKARAIASNASASANADGRGAPAEAADADGAARGTGPLLLERPSLSYPYNLWFAVEDAAREPEVIEVLPSTRTVAEPQGAATGEVGEASTRSVDGASASSGAEIVGGATTGAGEGGETRAASGAAGTTENVDDESAKAAAASQQLGLKTAHRDHSYDVVCAFSLTKWVHLAHGDRGLLRLFRSVHAILRPGGRFIVEPQPWRSYRRAVGRDAGATARAHFEQIKMRPDQFERILLSEQVGFSSVQHLGIPNAEGLSDGFKRPIFCFVK